MKNQNISKLENNNSIKNVEKIIIHRYQKTDGTYELELQNINKVLKNTEIISEEINTNPKYVKIYNNSLKKAIKPLKLEELMTQACKKQVEAATAEYKIKLEASDNRIQQLESENKDFRLGRQESDNRIQQLENAVKELTKKIV